MSYDTYRLIFIGAAIACGVMFLVSVTLFFVFKIPNIIGNLTGRNAKKAIEDIKRQNESYAYSDKANALNGKKKITEKISTARLDNIGETTVLGYNGEDETTILGNSGTDETTVLGNNGTDETTVLGYSGEDEITVLGNNGTDETTVLGNNGTDETTVLGNNGTDETTVLGNNGEDKTTVLGNNGEDETIVLGYSGELPKQMMSDAEFIVTEEIRFIHTKEWI